MSQTQEIAKYILTTYSELEKARTKVSHYIDDEIESSDEFDDHELAACYKAANSSLKALQNLIASMLRTNVDGEQLRSEISKLLLVEALKGEKNKMLNRIVGTEK